MYGIYRKGWRSFNTSNLVYHLKTKRFCRFLTLKETKESERKTLKKETSEKKSVGGSRQLTCMYFRDHTTGQRTGEDT